MPDTAHLVGGQAEILPGVFLGHVGDAQGLVEVLKLGPVGWQIPAFLVPCNVWCGAKRDQVKNRDLPPNVALPRLWSPGHHGVLMVSSGSGGCVSFEG